MKVIDGFINDFQEMTVKSHPNLMGKSFRSFVDIVELLEPGETVTTKHISKGYKQVGKDSKHKGWVQRNFVHEY